MRSIKTTAVMCLMACAPGLILFMPENARGEQPPIKIYTTADGLVSNRISRIVRDSRGYLWFCTEDGLSRFDGYTFTNYTMRQGLPSNWVDDFLETSRGVFLVGTNAGLCVFDPTGEPLPQDRLTDQPDARPMFAVSRPDAGGLAAHVKVLYEDSLGNIWCGTRRGLYRVEIAGRQVIYHEINLGIRHSEAIYHLIRSIVEDSPGLLWVLTNTELLRHAPDGRTERFALGKRLPNAGLMHLVKGPEGNLWVATREGMCRITPPAPDAPSKDPLASEVNRPSLVARRYSFAEGLSCVEMTVLYQDSSGRLWAGTDYGLYEFLKEENRFRLRLGVKDIRDARVWAFNEDRFENLWVGTANGAIRLAHKGFTTFTEADGIGFRDVYHITEPRAGEINLYTRFGESNFFLDKFNGEGFISRRIVPRAFQAQAFDWYLGQIPIRDRQGEWWWPTKEGLFRYRRAARIEDIISARPIAHYTMKDGLPTDFLRDVYEDGRGDIWISVASRTTRVVRWERATGKFQVYSSTDGLPAEHTSSSVCEDKSGNLWVGFAQGGLARFRHGRFTTFGAADGVPHGAIRRLLLDSQGRIWIASNDGGLGKIEDVAAERPPITAYTMADGLASNSILDIAEDRADQFYVATNRGLNHVDFNTRAVKRFTANDGLVNDQVDVIFRDSRGAFWFGTATGVSRLLPQAEPPQSAPPIFINSLKITGQSQRISEVGETDLRGLELFPGQNQIEIGFGSLAFGASDAIRYQYRLEGADADWLPLSAQRTVNYANLAPGHYRFLVRAVTASGVVSQSPASCSFSVLPPLWQRWWFLTLAALTLGLISYGLHRYRVAQLLALERTRTRIAADLHDEIGSNLSQIAVWSEVVRQQPGRQPAPPATGMTGHDDAAFDPLAHIAAVARETSGAMSDIVWAINPRRDHLSDLATRMRRLASEVFDARNIAWSFATPTGDLDLRTETRREIFLIFKEGVNNILRHAGCRNVELGLQLENDRLQLTIADDGCGFVAPTRGGGGGNGLESMRERAHILGGHLAIKSAPGLGTALLLSVPLKHSRWRQFFKWRHYTCV